MSHDPPATTQDGAAEVGATGPPPLRPLVTVIVVSHDGAALLSPCLDSVRKQSHSRFEVILVDNGSLDGTADRVALDYPEVRLVRLDENVGYAGGNNAGIALARGEYILLLNNDATLAPSALEILVDFMEAHLRAGLIGPLIVREDDPSTVDNFGLALYPDGTVRGSGRGDPAGDFAAVLDVFCPSGCACLCRREVLDRVGPFDEDFHLMLEDADLGWRARLAGWECYCVPSAVARHRGSATIGAYSARKAYYVERNRIWLALKYFPAARLGKSPIYSIARYAYQGWAILRGRGASSRACASLGPLALAWILARAYGSAAAGLPTMLRRRREIARNRRVSSAEILEWFDRYRLTARELALTA